MFKVGDIVLHKKSNTQYDIIETPDKCFIEKGLVPAYAYSNYDKTKIFVRPQTEMEDGRFEVIGIVGETTIT